MPQFQFAENFLPQFFWLAAFFAILYFGIVKATLPRVGTVVDAREKQVNGDIASAEAAKAQADTFAADYAAELEAAHRNARAAIESAKGEASARFEAASRACDSALAEQAAAAEAVLDRARIKALAEIELVATDAACDIVERLTGNRPDAATLGKAASAALVA